MWEKLKGKAKVNCNLIFELSRKHTNERHVQCFKLWLQESLIVDKFWHVYTISGPCRSRKMNKQQLAVYNQISFFFIGFFSIFLTVITSCETGINGFHMFPQGYRKGNIMDGSIFSSTCLSIPRREIVHEFCHTHFSQHSCADKSPKLFSKDANTKNNHRLYFNIWHLISNDSNDVDFSRF